MPELPDVETFKRYFDSTALHKKIDDVDVGSADVLEGVSKKKLSSTLEGHRFKSTSRHGKYLFADLAGGPWLVLHFGMTGYLKYYRDQEKEPEHDRVDVEFSNGYHLAYVCQRKFGMLGITDDPDDFVEKKDLGPDAMEIGVDEFNERLGGSRASLKSALMDQSLIAGIGNVYSDEILFQARLNPKKNANDLIRKDLTNLYSSMQRVLDVTTGHEADPSKFPRSYITRIRGEDDAECPRCGGKVKTAKVSGRTAYFCPKCQKG